jgi:hypothetical protein
MDIARQHFLAGARFARDHHRRIGAGDLLRQLDHLAHHLVAIDQVAAVIGDGGENGGDQFRIRRQGDVFFGAGMDRGDRGAGIGGDAAGDDRYMDVFGFQPHHEVADVEGDIHQQEVCALAAAQHAHRLIMAFGMNHGGAVIHGDLGGGGELALEGTNDEKPHGDLLLYPGRALEAPFIPN